MPVLAASTALAPTAPRSPSSNPAPGRRRQGLKIIDQGQNDPRAQGLFHARGTQGRDRRRLPGGHNPVGMTFGDDGTLYVLEWRPDPGAELPRDAGDRSPTRTAPRASVADHEEEASRTSSRCCATPRARASTTRPRSSSKTSCRRASCCTTAGSTSPAGARVRRYKQSKPDGPYDVQARSSPRASAASTITRSRA